MTKWTAPDIASLRGDNSRPLQKIFGSLTEYLKDTLSQTTEVSQTYVRNGETTALTIGTVVYLDARQGNRATVKRAFNTSDATSAKTLGVVAELIPAHGDGLVTTLGYLEKVNTSAFTAGQTLYLGATAGTFTATKPHAPNHMVYVGVVVRANAGNGIIYVRCQNGYELDEIHDVLITSPTAGQTLSYDAVNSLWKNATFSDGGGLTNLNASNLASGTVPTGRMSGSYAGITGVGTLSGLTSSARVWAQTDLRVGNANSTVLSSTLYNLVVTPQAYTGLQVLLGEHYGLTSVGTTNNDFTVFANTTVRIKYVNTTIATFNSTGMTIDGAGSPSFTLGDTGFAGYSGLVGDKGYLLLGNSVSDPVMYLRTSGSGPVYLGAANSNTLQVGNGSTTLIAGSGITMQATTQTMINGTNNNAGIYLGGGIASTATGGIEASWRDAANPSIAIGVTRDNNRTMTVHSYVDNTIRFFAGNTVKAYVNSSGFLATHYYGNVQYGFYGSMSVYGINNSWYGIVFPESASTMMVQNNTFGHYRNNSTWNFYVTGGTFTPSDARYKRDIEPLEHGMNFIREIVPVTYDPLTENTDDDPEATVGRTHYGFTTQNILQALTNAGETRDVAIVDVGGCDLSMGSDRQYLNHSALIAPIVKAIQELDLRLQQLETV
jgi:hypothetical protein